MYTYTSTTRIVRDSGRGQRRANTMQHIERGGLPLRPDLIAKRAEKLANGEYDRNPDTIVEDLSEDLALFGWATRLLGARHQDDAAGFNPLTATANLTGAERQQILSIRTDQISKHRFSQWSRLHLSFAEKASASQAFVDALLSHGPAGGAIERPDLNAAVLFEELGWQLFVWNYPHVLSSFFRRKLSRERLATEMRESFGCSPSDLAADIALRCHVDGRVSDSLQSKPPFRALPLDEIELRRHIRSAHETVSIFSAGTCSILAHETAADRQRELEKRMAGLGISSARSVVDEANDRYQAAKQELGDAIDSIKRSRRPFPRAVVPPVAPRTAPAAPVWKRDTADGTRLAPEIREILQNITDQLSGGSGPEQVLREIFEQIAPAAGFSHGCIFFNAPDGARLVPALAFTTESRPGPETLRRAMTSARMSADSALPFTEQDIKENGELRETISGAFGSGERQGVLWLEVESARVEASDYDGRRGFNLVRKCVEACLK